MPTPVNEETATIDTTPKALENKGCYISPKTQGCTPSEIDTIETKKLYGQQENQIDPKINEISHTHNDSSPKQPSPTSNSLAIASPKANLGIIETSTNKVNGPPNASKILLPSPLPNTNRIKLPATSKNNQHLSIDPTKAPTANNLEHTSPNKERSITPKAIIDTNEKYLTPIAAAAPTTTIDNHTIRQTQMKLNFLPWIKTTKRYPPILRSNH